MSSDLYNELQNKVALLDKALRMLGKRGCEKAQTERDYKVKLAERILRERDQGTPVTIIGDVCRGSSEIAKLRFERDVADVMYKSALEAINTYKLQIRLLESQIQREYGG